MRNMLKKVMSGMALTEDESFEMIRQMTLEENAAAGGLLAAIAMRGEQISELAGCVRYLRENMIPVPVRGPCADIVGTGGDGGKTFNISTAAAFVAAGAGVRIAKHGNRAVSSSCGAADVMESLGINLDKSPEQLEKSAEEHGFAFLFARKFHPVMAKVAHLRQTLGIRTIFNLAGPLANPAKAEYMVVGVYERKRIRPFAEVLRQSGVKRALVVHSDDGMDEISSLAATHAVFLNEGTVGDFTVDPGRYLKDEEMRGSLAGGTVPENSRILTDILSDRDHTARRGAVLLNAAALCMVYGIASDMKEGIALAGQSIRSGAALSVLREAGR